MADNDMRPSAKQMLQAAHFSQQTDVSKRYLSSIVAKTVIDEWKRGGSLLDVDMFRGAGGWET